MFNILTFIDKLIICKGSYRDKFDFPQFFAIVLLISLAELSAGVYAYIHRDQFIDYFQKLMTNSVQNLYDRDEYATKAWDVIQKEVM